MGVLAFVLVALGFAVGHHVARLSRTELKAGQAYFSWLERGLLGVSIGFFVNDIIGMNAGIAAGLFLFALLWEYPLEKYSVAGGFLGVLSSTMVEPVLMASYVYFLVAGTQTYYHKQSYFQPAIVFLIAALLAGIFTGATFSLF